MICLKTIFQLYEGKGKIGVMFHVYYDTYLVDYIKTRAWKRTEWF